MDGDLRNKEMKIAPYHFDTGAIYSFNKDPFQHPFLCDEQFLWDV